MILILVVNLLVVCLAIVLPNDFLVWHSYLLFGIQFGTLVPYLLHRSFFSKNAFLPSLFVVSYYLVNLTLGAYLVPRSFGWNKEYADASLSIATYNMIVPYLLLSNIVLFLLSCSTMKELAELKPSNTMRLSRFSGSGTSLPHFWELLCLTAFFGLAYLDVYSAFTFQLAILVVHLGELSRRRSSHRYVVYGLYLAGLVAFDFDNKREIAMTLFLVVFLEAYYGRQLLRMGLKNVLRYVFAAICFFALILTASILRGYGSFGAVSPLEAAALVPRYVSSDLFVDGLTDNLELNYNYGTAITAIDLSLRGAIPMQYGASLWKVLFLPIPRAIFPAKPESIMQLYTRIYSPAMWANNGSLPVIFPAEMFLNFGYFGLLPFAFVMLGINKLFVRFHRSSPHTLAYYACAFLIITVLPFARGSGLELYVLPLLLATPVFLFVVLLRRGARWYSNAVRIGAKLPIRESLSR